MFQYVACHVHRGLGWHLSKRETWSQQVWLNVMWMKFWCIAISVNISACCLEYKINKSHDHMLLYGIIKLLLLFSLFWLRDLKQQELYIVHAKGLRWTGIESNPQLPSVIDKGWINHMYLKNFRTQTAALQGHSPESSSVRKTQDHVKGSDI